jgi:hypothetical protein
MNWLTWQYLTSEAGVPVLVAFIGVAGALITAIVGVSATILVQVLAARSTRKREIARLEFDRTRWLHEQEVAATARFEDAKREAYVGWIMSLGQFLEPFREVEREAAARGFLLLTKRKFWREINRAAEDLTRHSSAISLLSPDLKVDVEALMSHVDGVRASDWTNEWIDQFEELETKVVERMQQSLGIRAQARSVATGGSERVSALDVVSGGPTLSEFGGGPTLV